MREPIAIVDYEAGNLTSVYNALKYLGISSVVTKDPKVISRAERVIFPGVGAAKSAMANLLATGLGQAVKDAVKAKKPVLGICIGCQIVLEHSEENGGVHCLGIVAGKAVRFHDEEHLKIPHMGWNQVEFAYPHPVFAGIPDQSDFYFVHSYHPVLFHPGDAAAYTTYGKQRFASALFRDNLVATQFHVEKSGDVGLQLLKNFCQWDGKC